MKKILSKFNSNDSKVKAISEELRKRFSIFQTSNLKSITAIEFTQQIQSRIGIVDSQSEGYSEDELDKQRDLSIKFFWGHNHDFGDFKLEGVMGDRHINLLTNFITFFPVTLKDFEGKNIFDIGCWTGGTALLLTSLGSKVFAIEEVKKYANTVLFLAKSFGLNDQISILPKSIYNCNTEEFYDRFDIVYFPGVIYHLSDPLLALRILFNSLKVGGIILVESDGINTKEAYCRFDGSRIYNPGGSEENLNRSGWNWFMPSPSALYRMMREAGFDNIETRWDDGTERVYGFGRKVSQVGICKAGLSVPSIK
jgi:SAM-dependent methyltransferase